MVGHSGQAEWAGLGSVQALGEGQGQSRADIRVLVLQTHRVRPGRFPLVGHRLGLTRSLLKGSMQSLG